MTHHKYTIVMAVYNNIEYTLKALNCLIKDDLSQVKVIVINNGSTDGTKDSLDKFSQFEIIHNKKNLGCAPAWNQGIELSQSEWTVILNNDVLLHPGWLQALSDHAEKNGVDIISPAFREGHYTDNFSEYADRYIKEMSHVTRDNIANGICFMIHKKVFQEIGVIDENFKIGQYEDTDFFWRAKKAGFKLESSGCALVQHFGSITQKTMKKNKEPEYALKNRLYFRKKWGLTWFRRKYLKFIEARQLKYYRRTEYTKHKHTLFERLKGDEIEYQ